MKFKSKKCKFLIISPNYSSGNLSGIGKLTTSLKDSFLKSVIVDIKYVEETKLGILEKKNCLINYSKILLFFILDFLNAFLNQRKNSKVIQFLILRKSMFTR